jgi:Cu+-exporting ATPase
MTSAAESLTAVRSLDLPVQAMTCASCAARIERKLNRMAGVTASVNYATALAHVTFPTDLHPRELVATVERTGYSAQLPSPPERAAPEETAAGHGEPEETGAGHSEPDADLVALRRRLLVGAVLALPVLLLGWSRPCASTAGRGSAWPWRRPSPPGRHGRFTGQR